MKFSQRILLAVMLVLALLLNSCNKGDESFSQTNFKQGLSELQLRFLEQAPPERIYPESDFKLLVEASNLAAYDISQGKVWITGTFDKYFLIQPQEQDLLQGTVRGMLEGRSLLNPAGDTTLLEFSGKSGLLFQNAEQEVSTFFLKAKYHSTFEFSDTICINPNLYAVYDAGCKIEEVKSYSGQGAPIAVTGLQEIMTPAPGARVEFRLTVANQGIGNLKKLELRQARLGGESLVCVFQGTGADLRSLDFTKRQDLGRQAGQQVVVICQHELSDSTSYSTSLFLEFAYDYELKQQHTLRLVR